ncbi:hypothetical protein ACLOJK_027310 [Asimina triloba]
MLQEQKSYKDRKKRILQHASYLAESVGGKLVILGNLLEEVVNLVEAPVPLLGKFDESFLELPEDLLIMRSRLVQCIELPHIAGFGKGCPCTQPDPCFYKEAVSCDSNLLLEVTKAATLSIVPRHALMLKTKIAFGCYAEAPKVGNGVIDVAVVRKGNEAVLSIAALTLKLVCYAVSVLVWKNEMTLSHITFYFLHFHIVLLDRAYDTLTVHRARYEDARFFYKMDTNKKFSEFRSQLNGILFHEKLGTVLDKMARVQRVVDKLTLDMGMDDNVLPVVQDAASLAMSDLATSVVTEFTSLSGIMARHYALRDGYSTQIAEALFEITLPRFSGDVLPKTDAGIVLAISDRLDSLVGLFGVGCQPSSTNDPFGLRRITYGLVQVLVENKKDLDLRNALRLAADVQPIAVNASTINDVDKGISSEIVRSVLSERANWPCLAAQSAMKMDDLSRDELFPKVIEAYSRPTRIIRGKDLDVDMEVSESTFQTNEERVLWSTYLVVKSKIHPGVEVDDFIEASSKLLQPLEDFFNNEDESVRKNRLALLKKIADLPRGVADLSVLPGF